MLFCLPCRAYHQWGALLLWSSPTPNNFTPLTYIWGTLCTGTSKFLIFPNIPDSLRIIGAQTIRDRTRQGSRGQGTGGRKRIISTDSTLSAAASGISASPALLQSGHKPPNLLEPSLSPDPQIKPLNLFMGFLPCSQAPFSPSSSVTNYVFYKEGQSHYGLKIIEKSWGKTLFLN